MKKANEQPAGVLICGNTGLLDADAVRTVSQYYKTILCGALSLPAGHRSGLPKSVRVYSDGPASESFARVMAAHTPETVWYFSGYADEGDGLENETRVIRSLTEQCAANGCAKLIYISSVESDADPHAPDGGQRGFCCAQAEALAVRCAQSLQLKTVVLRAPRLVREDGRGSWLEARLRALKEGGEVVLPGAAEARAELLSLRSLTDLLISITEETLDDSGLYTVESGFRHTWGEAGALLLSRNPAARLVFSAEAGPAAFEELPAGAEAAPAREAPLPLPRGSLRKHYGYVVTDDVIPRLPEICDAFLAGEAPRSGLLSRARGLLARAPRWLLTGAELLLLFVGLQLLLRVTRDSVYFRYVDLRLFYVLILGSAHGMTAGLLAGLLSSVSLFFAYTDSGITWMMLFYNVEYWLPFAVYLMTGAITGYIRSKKEQQVQALEEELLSLQQKYLFLNDIYLSVIANKKEYKRQILGYSDSFGKIFEAVQSLDSSLPSDIFMRGVETMERILENNSIAIYTLDGYQRFGRLVASSGALNARQLAKSLVIGDIREVYDRLLAGETWRNRELRQDLPAYASGILENGKVRLIICVWEAEPEQMSLYFTNLFTILCNLIRFSFTRALEYQEAARRERCVEGTDILKYEYFRREVEVHRRMTETGVASHILVRLPGTSPETAGEKLRRVIRSTDLIGVNSRGECCLLLAQVTGDTFRFVEDRLKSADIDYAITEEL